MTICCSSSNPEVEIPRRSNARSQTPIQATQQIHLRQTYSSPMRPSQYTQASKNLEGAKDTPHEATVCLERERISIEQVLLGRRWVFHCASLLFHFHCDHLSEYAHDLVKALRDAALRACGQQFGYSVSIRNTNSIVAFEIREERNCRSNIERNLGLEGVERSGGFVLYLPRDDEQRSAALQGQEKQQVILLRGDAELLRWVRSWLQHRFQCVVSIHAVHIPQQNLKRLARNWAVASLIAEGARPLSPEKRVANQERKSSSLLRAPLLLKYRATKKADVLRTYTMTVPWATLRRLFQQTKDRLKGSRPFPELIELVERLYLDSLPFDLTRYEIEQVEMQQVGIYADGNVELYSMDFVHTVLSTLLELLAEQSNATFPRPETTL